MMPRQMARQRASGQQKQGELVVLKTIFLSFVKHRYFGLTMGLIIMVSGLTEIVKEITEWESDGLGVHHGVFFVGLTHVLHGVAEIFTSTEEIAS